MPFVQPCLESCSATCSLWLAGFESHLAPDWSNSAGPSKPFTQDKEPRVVKITRVDAITKVFTKVDNRFMDAITKVFYKSIASG